MQRRAFDEAVLMPVGIDDQGLAPPLSRRRQALWRVITNCQARADGFSLLDGVPVVWIAPGR